MRRLTEKISNTAKSLFVFLMLVLAGADFATFFFRDPTGWEMVLVMSALTVGAFEKGKSL